MCSTSSTEPADAAKVLLLVPTVLFVAELSCSDPPFRPVLKAKGPAFASSCAADAVLELWGSSARSACCLDAAMALWLLSGRCITGPCRSLLAAAKGLKGVGTGGGSGDAASAAAAAGARLLVVASVAGDGT